MGAGCRSPTWPRSDGATPPRSPSCTGATSSTVLRDAVGERALRLGVTCTGVVQDDRTACVQLDDGGHEEGDVVVAADGVGSRLREAARGRRHGAGPPDSSPGAPSCRSDGVDVDAVAGEAWGHGELFGAAPLTHGRLYWFASSRAPAVGRRLGGGGARSAGSSASRAGTTPSPPSSRTTAPARDHPHAAARAHGAAGVDQRSRRAARRRRARHAAEPRPGRLPGGRGRVGAGQVARGTAPRHRKRFAPTSAPASREPRTSPASRDG